MRFVDNELDSLVDRLQERTIDWLCFYDDWNTILGNIGEKLVGICICHGLWKLGYPLDLTNRPYSYKIKPRYKADADGYRGVDFLLSIVDSDEIRHLYLIEVKNWDNYSITPDTFQNEILSRFTGIDVERHCSWILVMNESNWRYIRQQCENHNIYLLELPHQITHDDVFDCELIENILSGFIDSFCSLITGLCKEKSYPYLYVENIDKKPKWSMIDQDLLLGVPYDIIESRYNTTKSYISKCATDFRRWFDILPDRRHKDWRLAWEVQE